MLVLSRKINEKIKIGDDIEITIVAINGDVIRVGIAAPSTMRILRGELYEEVQRQNSAAAAAPQITASLKSLVKSLTDETSSK